MTADPTDALTEALAATLAEHASWHGPVQENRWCQCGWPGFPEAFVDRDKPGRWLRHREHLAAALVPVVVAREHAAARKALTDAADAITNGSDLTPGNVRGFLRDRAEQEDE
jgi:hypothetical protein